jgi:hypothetical protein
MDTIRCFTKNRDVDKMILSNLNYIDVLSVCQVNKYSNSLCDDNFWRNKLRKDFPLRSKYVYCSKYLSLSAKDLYKVINRKSKIVTLNSKKFRNPDYLYDVHAGIYIDGIFQNITEDILLEKETLELLRGDVIFLGWSTSYGNNNKLIWDGEKVLDLDSYDPDSGNVPKELSFPEFPLDHFYHSINDNRIIHLSPSAVFEAIKNFNEESQITIISDLYSSYEIGLQKESDVRDINLCKASFKEFIEKYPFIDVYVNKYTIGGYFVSFKNFVYE